MARALVLGATGHIGAHVVRALLAEGHEVRAAYRRDQFLGVLDGLSIERVHVDLNTQAGLTGALEGCEWVFHAAGSYPGFLARRADAVAPAIEVTRRLFERLRRARPARVIYTSSAATIRALPDRAATETDAERWPPAGWHTLYATVKIAMEHEALRAHEAGLPIVIMNPSLCIGEYDAHPFSGQAILAFAKHRLPFYLDSHLNVIYTGDVGVGHVRAAERGRPGERYLLTRDQIGIREFAERVAELAGVLLPRWRVPYRVAYAAACAAESWAWMSRREPVLTRQVVQATRSGGKRLDGRRAVEELGLPQTTIDEALRRAVGWFKEHGYLG